MQLFDYTITDNHCVTTVFTELASNYGLIMTAKLPTVDAFVTGYPSVVPGDGLAVTGYYQGFNQLWKGHS